MITLAPTLDRMRLLRRWLEQTAGLLDLGIRLHVANVFWKSGLTKIEDWDKTVYLFTEVYRVPVLPPEWAAALGTFGEIAFPPLLALGLATRFTALSLSAVNAVAVISFWHVLSQNEAALMSHFYWSLLLLVTLLHGPGWLSVDRWLWPWIERKAGAFPTAK